MRIEPDQRDRSTRRLASTASGVTLLQRAYVVWSKVEGAIIADPAGEDVDGVLASLHTSRRS